MKRRRALLLIAAALALLIGCMSQSARLRGNRRPGCFSGRIYIADMGRGRLLCTTENSGLPAAGDFWAPAEAVDLTPEQKTLFLPDEMNECKPAVFHGERVILATAWPSGFAVVRAADAKVLFVAEAPRGVHSAEVLPENVLVTASSTGGDCVKVYSSTTDETAEYPLTGAHGVVYDKRRKLLWALGTDMLNTYTFDFDPDNPKLTLKDSIPLPETGGHDLYPRARRDELFVTTSDHVWVFSPKQRSFKKFAPLCDTPNVKSVGEKSGDGRILFTTWNDKLLFARPSGESPRPGADIYKARWDRLPEFIYGYPLPPSAFPGFPTHIITVP